MYISYIYIYIYIYNLKMRTPGSGFEGRFVGPFATRPHAGSIAMAVLFALNTTAGLIRCWRLIQ